MSLIFHFHWQVLTRIHGICTLVADRSPAATVVTVNLVTLIMSLPDFCFNVVVWVGSKGAVHKPKASLEEKMNGIENLDVDADLLHSVYDLHEEQNKL